MYLNSVRNTVMLETLIPQRGSYSEALLLYTAADEVMTSVPLGVDDELHDDEGWAASLEEDCVALVLKFIINNNVHFLPQAKHLVGFGGRAVGTGYVGEEFFVKL
uniref:Uncharacterized protein n=1 Tax=Anopheles culicifacies TaxID=139723 RepID=A0A182MCT5_9DIPT